MSAAAVARTVTDETGSLVQVWKLTTPGHMAAWLVWWCGQECDGGAASVLAATLGAVVGAWGHKGDTGVSLLLEMLAGHCAAYGDDAASRIGGLGGCRTRVEWQGIRGAVEALYEWSTGDTQAAESLWVLALECFVEGAVLAVMQRSDAYPAFFQGPLGGRAIERCADVALERARDLWVRAAEVGIPGFELERVGVALERADDAQRAAVLGSALALCGPASTVGRDGFSWVAGMDPVPADAPALPPQDEDALCGSCRRVAPHRWFSLPDGEGQWRCSECGAASREASKTVHYREGGWNQTACGAALYSAPSSADRRVVTCDPCRVSRWWVGPPPLAPAPTAAAPALLPCCFRRWGELTSCGLESAPVSSNVWEGVTCKRCCAEASRVRADLVRRLSDAQRSGFARALAANERADELSDRLMEIHAKGTVAQWREIDVELARAIRAFSQRFEAPFTIGGAS